MEVIRTFIRQIKAESHCSIILRQNNPKLKKKSQRITTLRPLPSALINTRRGTTPNPIFYIHPSSSSIRRTYLFTRNPVLQRERSPFRSAVEAPNQRCADDRRSVGGGVTSTVRPQDASALQAVGTWCRPTPRSRYVIVTSDHDCSGLAGAPLGEPSALRGSGRRPAGNRSSSNHVFVAIAVTYRQHRWYVRFSKFLFF